MNYRLIALLLGLLLAVALCACGGSSAPAPAPASAEMEETAEEAADEGEEINTFENGVMLTKDIRVEITDWKVIPVGQTGNEYGEKPVLAIWYDTTNISGEDTNPILAWVLYFKAYQDTDPNQVNELTVGALPDDAFLESQMEQIKQGGTAPCATAYELDSTTVPVVLKSGPFGDGSYGEMTFDIAQ